MKYMFGKCRVFKVKGPGVGPRTYCCPYCGKKMMRAIEVLQRHFHVHGESLNESTAFKRAVEDLDEVRTR